MKIESLIRDLKKEFGDAVTYYEDSPAEEKSPADGDSPVEPEEPRVQSETDNVVIVESRRLKAVCNFLHQKGFDYLLTLTAVDFPERDTIEMLYFPSAIKEKLRLVLRCLLPRDKPEIESVTSVWKAAEFPEREVFDLFGVVFKNHPDLRKIFLDDDFEGFPMRKDWDADFFLKKPEVKFR